MIGVSCQWATFAEAVEDGRGALVDACLPMVLVQVAVLIMAFCILGWRVE